LFFKRTGARIDVHPFVMAITVMPIVVMTIVVMNIVLIKIAPAGSRK